MRNVGLGSERVTSPSPSPKIRRRRQNSLCPNSFVLPARELLLALRLGFALGRTHRVDAGQLDGELDQLARLAAAARARLAQTAGYLGGASIENRGRAVVAPGGERDAGIFCQIGRRTAFS